MQIESVFKFLAAAHHSHLVNSNAQERGGVFLLSGPGNMKSTIVKNAIGSLSGTLVYSDLTLKQLAVVRNEIAAGSYQTLAFLEVEKLYARNLSVAMNLEGVIKALVEEGFAHFAFEDKRMWVPTARCLVVGSLLQSVYNANFSRWVENGFLRRFILLKYSLSRETREAMNQEGDEGRKLPFPPHRHIPTGTIQMNVSREESRFLRELLGSGIGDTPLNLMRKILSVLKHNYAQGDKSQKPLEIMEDLRDCIQGSEGVLIVPAQKKTKRLTKRRKKH